MHVRNGMSNTKYLFLLDKVYFYWSSIHLMSFSKYLCFGCCGISVTPRKTDILRYAHLWAYAHAKDVLFLGVFQWLTQVFVMQPSSLCYTDVKKERRRTLMSKALHDFLMWECLRVETNGRTKAGTVETNHFLVTLSSAGRQSVLFESCTALTTNTQAIRHL